MISIMIASSEGYENSLFTFSLYFLFHNRLSFFKKIYKFYIESCLHLLGTHVDSNKIIRSCFDIRAVCQPYLAISVSFKSIINESYWLILILIWSVLYDFLIKSLKSDPQVRGPELLWYLDGPTYLVNSPLSLWFNLIIFIE